jgi:hypothetical protein
VAFYVVYIREAHTSDVWQDPDNLDDHIIFASPKNIAERSEMGQLCVVKLGIHFPAYKARPGPFGFKPQGVADTLQKLVPSALNH